MPLVEFGHMHFGGTKFKKLRINGQKLDAKQHKFT